ncbi:FabD/lysophospholipase-like protein [Bimuria novae-zelandiae CBS 107.79]|uniref:FabD/lysophospholipase-like protein n=1 Tax=Bimuria novae-zelandiae CBS 107.79 TaxID=1447943 RepID=A0A6A5UM65_9PLEO|nr:FabD/lysophospholipase-like protein [Bimuria novae-zelandiae CBS 107.79]
MSPELPQRCEETHCNLVAEWYCVDCAIYFCDNCWTWFPAHAAGRTGRDKKPHEKTQYRTFKRLDAILDPSYAPGTLEELRRQDLDSTWFGIRRDDQGHMLVDYDAYSTLMGGVYGRSGPTFPQLVSFVGQTNAGKSTLIKMLIQLKEDTEMDESGPSFPSPIVGAPGSKLPTSADVHLYADPSTYRSSKPILYADCEGLEGGSKLPVGAVENILSQHKSIPYARWTPGRKTRLEWAKSPETNKREFVVGQLYPRILYTFSSVVVFVLQNAKTFESTALRLLLEWGAASLERSVNQPALPHAIIALNSTDTGLRDSEWVSKNARQSLLDSAKDCLDLDPYFSELARQWRQKGKQIRQPSDLLHCYYSTFQVVPIPVKGRYQLLNDQIEVLHASINSALQLSFKAKQRARMLSDSDELNIYFQSAFEHFSHRQGLNTPFNFVEVSLKVNPIPNNFAEHLLQLAVVVKTRWSRRESEWIFERLSDMVASSVMLDCVRHRKGIPGDLFDQYQLFFQSALIMFGEFHVPCEFRTPRGRCINMASAHAKGHQNLGGEIFAGNFVSSFNADNYLMTWRNNIKDAIQSIHKKLQGRIDRDRGSATEEEHFLPLHNKVMDDLYRQIGDADKYQSSSTCFCCLMRVPYHALPCGHALCTLCVRAYGHPMNKQRGNRFVFTMDFCPLHEQQTRSKWQGPFVVRFKPDHAGVRILCLDGGGVRAIVQLQILLMIQQQFRNQIPIQAFFDLILGTSSGGIVALAMAVKGWELHKCMDLLKRLYRKVFVPRDSMMSSMKYFITMKVPTKYKTTPMRKALEQEFGESETLFGHRIRDNANQAKVAVTATDTAIRRVIVIANYGRNESTQNGRRRRRWDFPRPNDPTDELKIWEAAVATMSSTLFKPFFHRPTKRTYLDGALYHNSPTKVANRERKLIWPDVANKHPDLFLSLGTGQNGSEIGRKLSQSTRSTSSRRYVSDNMDNILDAELAWQDFLEESAGDQISRYIRINPSISHEPPKHDEVDQMERLQEEMWAALSKPLIKSQVEHVTHTLVASSFYCERSTVRGGGGDKPVFCSGKSNYS